MKRPRLHILQSRPSMFLMKRCRVSPLRVLLNFESLLQLTAGSVNVVAT